MNNTHKDKAAYTLLAISLLGCAFSAPACAQAGAGGAGSGTGASSSGTSAGAAGTTGGTSAGASGTTGGTAAGQNGTGAGPGDSQSSTGAGPGDSQSSAGAGPGDSQSSAGAGTGNGQTGANAGAGNGQNGTGGVGAGQTATGGIGTDSTTAGSATGQNSVGSGAGSGTNSQNSPSANNNGASGQNGGQSGAASGANSGGQSSGAGASGNLLPRQSAAPLRYNLAATIAAAIQSSSDLQVAARNVQIDRKRADEALAAGRPNVGLSGSATRFDKATSVSIGGSPPIQIIPVHTEQLSALVNDRLDLTGQIRASSNQLFLQSTADQFTYQSIRNARILRAKTIYFNLLRAQHQVQVAQAALTTAQRQLLDAQNLSAGQVGQKIDVYRAATQMATDQQQLTAAINNEQINEQNFNDLVGKPLATLNQVEDVLGVSVGNAIIDTSSVGANTQLSFTPFSVPASALAGIDLDQSLDAAFADRPELLVDQVNIRVAQTGITLARAGLQPTLALNASGNYFPTTSFQDPRRRTAAITATLNIPLYDGGATRDRVDEARLRTSNAQTFLDSDKSSVALDVRQSYLNLLTNARQIDAANTALQQAVAARQLAQIRYEGQVGLYLEVTDAQAALVQAETSQVNAVYDYLVARAQFENSIGRPQTR